MQPTFLLSVGLMEPFDVVRKEAKIRKLVTYVVKYLVVELPRRL